ncbi:MAG: helix-turn-helix domain-containing protein [Holosporaceae bacterium]|nr:helix-turn-helix domain-containing protein [Holosporaceae bacterium]
MTCEQRFRIQTRLAMEKSQRETAEKLGLNQSSISREIARNAAYKCYIFKIAVEKAFRHG